jgi:hypothetical protein
MRKSAQAMAEPYPKSNWVNAWLYWYRTIVMPASPAPPPLPSSTWGSVNRLSPPMVEVMTVNRMIGRISGMVMRKNTCLRLAPSTRAAS